MADETRQHANNSDAQRHRNNQRRRKATPRTRGVQLGATADETGAFAAVVSPDATADEIEAFFAQAEQAHMENAERRAARAAAREAEARAREQAEAAKSAPDDPLVHGAERAPRLDDPSVTLVHGGVSVRGLPEKRGQRAVQREEQPQRPRGHVPQINDAFVASVAASAGAQAPAGPKAAPGAGWRSGLPSFTDEPAASEAAAQEPPETAAAPSPEDLQPGVPSQLKPLYPSKGDSAQVDPFVALPDVPAIDDVPTPDDASLDYGQFGRVDQGFVSADPMYRERHRMRTILRNVAIAAVVIALAGLGAWYLWEHRGVEVTVNGARASAGSSATLGELYDSGKWTVNPGDLVSVNGTLLQEGAGDKYSALVDGEVLTPKEASTFMLKGGEVISFRDGADALEEFDVNVVETAPKLRMEGDETGTVQFVSQWGAPGRVEHRRGRTSGETTEVTVSEPQDCVITTLSPVPANDEKLVAITFDDGPSYYTGVLLKTLAEKNAHATFFNLGQYVDISPDVAASIVAGGNQLCSHTMTNLTLTEQPAETVYAEITNAFSSIERATGIKTTTFRPPNASFRPTTWVETGGAVSAAITWDVSVGDIAKPTADQIIAAVLRDVHPGAIVLMHDGGGDRTQDTIALPYLIDQLTAQGYRLVTVSELLASDARIPAEIAAGDATMPEGAAWPDGVAE